ncbi:MAG: DNA gyrase C-terminal beta-propeller domain-containing protein, partial [Bacteroidota bacterium]
KNNYIKRVSLNTYKIQNKGGKGRIGSHDDIAETIIATTHSMVLIFTNKGLVYVLFGYEIPEGDHYSKGRAIINLLNIGNDEKIIRFLVVSEEKIKNYQNWYLIFVHTNGQVRRNALEQFLSIRSNGKKYIKIEKIEQVFVLLVEETDYLFMATQNGMAICTNINEFRVFNSRDSEGVKGCRLRPGDKVIGAICSKSRDDLILTVTENGMGKISSCGDYRITHRGSVGVINIKKTSKKFNKVIDVINIKQDDEVILITEKSHFLRFSLKSMKIYGRNTIGLKLCSINSDDSVICVRKIVSEMFSDVESITNIENPEIINEI